jgi:hypothetical protein
MSWRNSLSSIFLTRTIGGELRIGSQRKTNTAGISWMRQLRLLPVEASARMTYSANITKSDIFVEQTLLPAPHAMGPSWLGFILEGEIFLDW